jgi:hypothetical protein
MFEPYLHGVPAHGGPHERCAMTFIHPTLLREIVNERNEELERRAAIARALRERRQPRSRPRWKLPNLVQSVRSAVRANVIAQRRRRLRRQLARLRAVPRE